MYGWIVNRLRNAEVEHIKNGEDKLAVLCRDAASVVVELNTRNKTLRELLQDRDTTIDSLNVSLETYRGLTEAMQHNQQAQWIPVTECLPDAYEDVLLQFPNNQAAGFCDRDGCWGVYSGDGFYTEVADNEPKPTHWAKKLPEPLKEEEK